MNSYKRSTYAVAGVSPAVETDGLTGLYNRSGFDGSLERRWKALHNLRT